MPRLPFVFTHIWKANRLSSVAVSYSGVEIPYSFRVIRVGSCQPHINRGSVKNDAKVTLSESSDAGTFNKLDGAIPVKYSIDQTLRLAPKKPFCWNECGRQEQ